jgi:hypothetical protein
MLPDAIAAEGVEAVARRIAQILEALGAVQQPELVERTILNVLLQLAAALAGPDQSCFAVGDAFDHAEVLTQESASNSGRLERARLNLCNR